MLRLVVTAVAFWLAIPWVIEASPAQFVHRKVTISSSLDFAAFAAIVAPALARIETDFRERRQALAVVSAGQQGEAYRMEEVERLLESVETQLLSTLEPQELAPLRDSIRLRFHRIHKELADAPRIGRLKEPASEIRGIALTSFGPAKPGPGGLLLRSIGEPLLETCMSILRRVTGLAEEKHFALRLCVISQPEPGATFRMWPPENQDGALVGDTARDIQEAPLGMYFYRVKYAKRSLEKKFGSIECKDPYDLCPVDLFDSKNDQLIVCDFGEKRCKMSNLSSVACPPQ